MPDLELAKLQDAILKLTLISHASASSYGGTSPSTDEDIGGKRPTGGIDHQGDKTPEYRQKSVDYFVRRFERCQHSPHRIHLLRLEAERALEDWMKTPEVAGVELERGSFRWKCKIADDERSTSEIVTFYNISRATLSRYQHKYRAVLRIPPTSVR